MSSNSSSSSDITEDHGSKVEIAVLALTAFGTCATLVFLITRLCCKYVIPDAWRLSLILYDLANLFLGLGLTFFLVYMGTGSAGVCSASGFFLLFGMLDMACMLCLVAIALLFIQNPGKLGQLSTFKKSWLVVFVVPEKVAVFVVALLPVLPIDYFDTSSPYPVACFPVRQEGGKGAAFGAILFFILWVLLILGIVLSAVCAFRLWKSNNSRIHASSPNLWQMEKIGQGRALQKTLFVEQLLVLVVTFITTVVLYTNSPSSHTPQWVVMVALAVAVVAHAGVCGVQLVMWSYACCCHGNKKAKEPYQKLKKLELIRVEGPGKIRLRASWSAGRGVTRRGLVKVYGLNQLKGWAQEIVVLGMLRKTQNASLLQCLWTANTNPYFETMTMLSGQIVTSEARLICLELTTSGNLCDFLQSLDVPLPEPCTRTILHDLAEGLATLHAQNILHRNLTSSAVYLKGSVQRLVLRAALGDFEEAQIYGSLQNGGGIGNTVSKKHFFLPDIRAFALVALEILGHVCQKRQEEKQPFRLITAPGAKSVEGVGGGRQDGGSRERGKKPRRENGTQFCAPGAAENFAERHGGRIVQVTGTPIGGKIGRNSNDPRKRTTTKNGTAEITTIGGTSTALSHHAYEDILDPDDGFVEGEVGMGTGATEEGHRMDPKGLDEDASFPAITHVREAYRFEFPNHSVFKGSDGQENDYEEIDDIEEEIHREVRYHALRRREANQIGGYIVTRTTSGREILLPATQHGHLTTSSMHTNSDSGYVGTSSNCSSRHPHPYHHPPEVDEPTDIVSWPKAAHRTTSANTISSFGDDILEVLPGMADEEEREMRTGDKTRRQLQQDREDARVEQIIESYEDRVRRGGLEHLDKDWPKLKFSRNMGEGTKGRPATPRRPGTPRSQTPRPATPGAQNTPRNASTPKNGSTPRQQETTSPRPKTAAPGAVKRIDRSRPLSASASTAGTWQLRSSFKKNKAKNELVRALSRGNSFLNARKPSSRDQRGMGGKSIEDKYAAHNAAFKHDDEDDVEVIDEVKNTPQQFEEPRVQTPLTPKQESSTLPQDYDHEQIKQVSDRTVKPVPAPRSRNIPTSHQPHNENHYGHQVPHQQQTPGTVNVGKFPSFSSSDSFNSYRRHQSKLDTSITSGEVASLSSQADTVREKQSKRSHTDSVQPPRKEEVKEDKAEKNVVVIPGMKIVDSGFDEDSVSVGSDASEEASLPTDKLSGEPCTCCCQSDLMTSDTCSCYCSQCQDSHSGSPRNSGWSETQSSGSWSNSNSFSSYDVQMHRRKLPSRPKRGQDSGLTGEDHVLGPDEQYPVHKPASVLPVQPHPLPENNSPTHQNSSSRQPPHHNHHHNHHRHSHHNHSRSGSTASRGSSNSSAASRRYRELTSKGVPLRVSVIDDEASRGNRHSACHYRQHSATAEVIEEEEDGLDTALYQDLESQGFFDSTDSASSRSGHNRQHHAHGKRRVSKRLEVVQGGGAPIHDLQDPFPLLEDIIREIPDETSGSCSGDETKAFLNRPESELSVKALRPVPRAVDDAATYTDVTPISDLHREPKVVHDAELVIDRMFSRAHPTNTKGSETFVDPVFGLDEAAIRQLAMMPPALTDPKSFEEEDALKTDLQMPLLIGTDTRHVKYVQKLAGDMDLLAVQELLPANVSNFHVLKKRLQQAGSFGTIGLQLLDIIGACWVQETPPTTADIVDQLTDHVTETEL